MQHICRHTPTHIRKETLTSEKERNHKKKNPKDLITVERKTK